MFSVALSIASRRPVVNRHLALWSPDFPLRPYGRSDCLASFGAEFNMWDALLVRHCRALEIQGGLVARYEPQHYLQRYMLGFAFLTTSPQVIRG
ncbi:MAG: hypothetical protein FD121_1062 [Gallionellaceae bacterium]|nr:MAG: hypothetical protein FD121_1062 [Gallionellaceae bacterium]